MSENEMKIMRTFMRILPELTEKQKSYLLGYGDGIISAREDKATKQEREVPVA